MDTYATKLLLLNLLPNNFDKKKFEGKISLNSLIIDIVKKDLKGL